MQTLPSTGPAGPNTGPGTFVFAVLNICLVENEPNWGPSGWMQGVIYSILTILGARHSKSPWRKLWAEYLSRTKQPAAWMIAI